MLMVIAKTNANQLEYFSLNYIRICIVNIYKSFHSIDRAVCALSMQMTFGLSKFL